MKILILNGPNLNMVGKREELHYGFESFEQIFEDLKKQFEDMELEYFQSNHEGEIIDRIHKLDEEKIEGLVINPGAYTHYSIAILDALRIIRIPKIEVHFSNILARETYRHTSMTAKACDGVISGLGKESYQLALQYFRKTQRTPIGFKKK